MQNQNTQTAKVSALSYATVTDFDVTRLMNFLESKAFLKKRLEQIDAHLETLEKELIARIEAGARINSRFPISVRTTERRYPSWKEAFVKVAGESEAKKIVDSTAPTISKSIVISSK